MLNNFQKKVYTNEDLSDLFENSAYSEREILIMASLIERETDGTDRRNISSVIHNRLEKGGETGRLLHPWSMPPVGPSPRRITRPGTAPTTSTSTRACPPRPSPTRAWRPSRRLWSRRIRTTISMSSWATSTYSAKRWPSTTGTWPRRRRPPPRRKSKRPWERE